MCVKISFKNYRMMTVDELFVPDGQNNILVTQHYCPDFKNYTYWSQNRKVEKPPTLDKPACVPTTVLCQFSSVTQSCLTLCDPMDCSTPGLPVHHQLLELAQTHVHRVGDAIQPSHPLLSPSPPAINLSQHQGLFQGVSSSHQVAKVLSALQAHQWCFH